MPLPIIEVICMLAFIGLLYMIVVFFVCREMTGTWNVFRFLFDYKYWSFAVLNHEYSISLDRDEDYRKFAIYFSKKQLMPRTKGVIQRMREKERKILVMHLMTLRSTLMVLRALLMLILLTVRKCVTASYSFYNQ